MYVWRKLTKRQRGELMEFRLRQKLPWHSLPHRQSEKIHYLLSAACYEHVPIIGRDLLRMAAFEAKLLQTLEENSERIIAWCVLPNHYHSLIETRSILTVVENIGRMHGKTSFCWNGEDNQRGRKVWFNCADRFMRSDRHFWATLNYIHNNPVHHGYVTRWQDWPFSSAGGYLSGMGKEKALEIWREYPLLDYGKSWDEAQL
jgi:putative transposase